MQDLESTTNEQLCDMWDRSHVDWQSELIFLYPSRVRRFEFYLSNTLRPHSLGVYNMESAQRRINNCHLLTFKRLLAWVMSKVGSTEVEKEGEPSLIFRIIPHGNCYQLSWNIFHSVFKAKMNNSIPSHFFFSPNMAWMGAESGTIFEQ